MFCQLFVIILIISIVAITILMIIVKTTIIVVIIAITVVSSRSFAGPLDFTSAAPCLFLRRIEVEWHLKPADLLELPSLRGAGFLAISKQKPSLQRL